MKRPTVAIAVACLGLVAAAPERPRVTGQVELPPAVNTPEKFRVVVEIYKLRKDTKETDILKIYQGVGRQEIGTARSFPVQFAVPYPDSTLKDATAKAFMMRAFVYQGGKLLYRTPDDERIEPFTARLEPRNNVRIVVKPVKARK